MSVLQHIGQHDPRALALLASTGRAFRDVAQANARKTAGRARTAGQAWRSKAAAQFVNAVRDAAVLTGLPMRKVFGAARRLGYELRSQDGTMPNGNRPENNPYPSFEKIVRYTQSGYRNSVNITVNKCQEAIECNHVDISYTRYKPGGQRDASWSVNITMGPDFEWRGRPAQHMRRAVEAQPWRLGPSAW